VPDDLAMGAYTRSQLRAYISQNPYLLSGAVCDIDAYVLEQNLETVSKTVRYPADWWQALKERWFSRAAKARWPVKWQVIEVKLERRARYPEADIVPTTLGQPYVFVRGGEYRHTED